jgi:hypothetical protein
VLPGSPGTLLSSLGIVGVLPLTPLSCPASVEESGAGTRETGDPVLGGSLLPVVSLYRDGDGGGDGIALSGRTVGPALLPGSPWTPGLDAPPVPGWFWSDWICAAEGLVNAAAASAAAARLFTMIGFIGHLLQLLGRFQENDSHAWTFRTHSTARPSVVIRSHTNRSATIRQDPGGSQLPFAEG